MRDVTRRRLQSLKDTANFYTNNSADWPVGTGGHTKFTALQAVIIDADAAAAIAASGESVASTDLKGGSREDLVDAARDISDLAKGLEPEFPGIGPTLHLRRGLNDADLIARCLAIWTDSATYETALTLNGMPADFRDHLKDMIDAFQATVTGQSSAVDERVAANATLESKVDTGMQLKRSLHPIVKLKYKDSPGKLAAWHTASHVEAAPKKNDPPDDDDQNNGGPVPPSP